MNFNIQNFYIGCCENQASLNTIIDISGTPTPIDVQDNAGSVIVVEHDGSVEINGTNSSTHPTLTPEFTLEAAHTQGNTGNTISVPVTVYNMNAILSAQFSVNYDDSLLQLDSITPGFFTLAEVSNPSPGNVSAVWFDPTFTGVTFVNQVLFTLEFTIL